MFFFYAMMLTMPDAKDVFVSFPFWPFSASCAPTVRRIGYDFVGERGIQA